MKSVSTPDNKPVTIVHGVRPRDFDRYGHVNNAVAMELFELGRQAWADQQQICLPDHAVPVLTRAEVDYLREITTQQVTIVTSLHSSSYFKLEFAQTINIPSQEENIPAVSGRIHVSIIDSETRKPMRLKHALKQQQDEAKTSSHPDKQTTQEQNIMPGHKTPDTV